jgi:hypothetical protein
MHEDLLRRCDPPVLTGAIIAAAPADREATG